jgi:hypothetical protein
MSDLGRNYLHPVDPTDAPFATYDASGIRWTYCLNKR